MSRDRAHLDRVRDALEQVAAEHERQGEQRSAAAQAAIAAARQQGEQIRARREAGRG